MGMWCETCEAKEEKCGMPGVHLCRDAAGLVARQEILFGMHEEEGRVDLAMGREAGAFTWKGAMMESGEEREMYRAQGRAAAARLTGARETRIGKQKCKICMVERWECDWPEVHFSSKWFNVGHCNEVCWLLECVV